MKWTERELVCRDDYEGPVVATLLSHLEQGRSRAILYIHGFIDYFFHEHVASAFVGKGWDFYALDLRKYGRSIQPHQTPNYCRDLKEYFEEIDQALDLIHTEGHETVVLLGHSMGGLLSSYYLHLGDNRNLVSGLILNAPFLDFYHHAVLKWVVPPVTGLIARLLPYAKQTEAVSPFYAQSMHKDFMGEWDFDLKKKPIKGFPAYFAWIPAIRRVQKYLYSAPLLDIPVLLLFSDRSMKPGKEWKDDYQSADIVLNVEDIKRHGQHLSRDMTLVEVKGAVHDIFLSREKVRDMAMRETLNWLNQF